MRHVPNILSLLRILLVLLLPPMPVAGYLWIAVYLMAGLTDAADGWMARRLGVQSSLGARLDSLGDIFLFGYIVFFCIKYIPWTLTSYLIYITAIIAVRIAAIVTSSVRYRKFTSLHTIANKAAGLCIFLLPLVYRLGIDMRIVFPVVLAIAFLSAAEELVIALASRKESCDPDVKSILHLRKIQVSPENI